MSGQELADGFTLGSASGIPDTPLIDALERWGREVPDCAINPELEPPIGPAQTSNEGLRLRGVIPVQLGTGGLTPQQQRVIRAAVQQAQAQDEGFSKRSAREADFASMVLPGQPYQSNAAGQAYQATTQGTTPLSTEDWLEVARQQERMNRATPLSPFPFSPSEQERLRQQQAARQLLDGAFGDTLRGARRHPDGRDIPAPAPAPAPQAPVSRGEPGKRKVLKLV